MRSLLLCILMCLILAACNGGGGGGGGKGPGGNSGGGSEISFNTVFEWDEDDAGDVATWGLPSGMAGILSGRKAIHTFVNGVLNPQDLSAPQGGALLSGVLQNSIFYFDDYYSVGILDTNGFMVIEHATGIVSTFVVPGYTYNSSDLSFYGIKGVAKLGSNWAVLLSWDGGARIAIENVGSITGRTDAIENGLVGGPNRLVWAEANNLMYTEDGISANSMYSIMARGKLIGTSDSFVATADPMPNGFDHIRYTFTVDANENVTATPVGTSLTSGNYEYMGSGIFKWDTSTPGVFGIGDKLNTLLTIDRNPMSYQVAYDGEDYSIYGVETEMGGNDHLSFFKTDKATGLAQVVSIPYGGGGFDFIYTTKNGNHYIMNDDSDALRIYMINEDFDTITEVYSNADRDILDNYYGMAGAKGTFYVSFEGRVMHIKISNNGNVVINPTAFQFTDPDMSDNAVLLRRFDDNRIMMSYEDDNSNEHIRIIEPTI